MSAWTHAMCRDCWDRLNPDRPYGLGREPNPPNVVLNACCFCDRPAVHGIYFRADPATTPRR